MFSGADLLGLDAVFGGAPQSTTQPNLAPVANDPFDLSGMPPVQLVDLKYLRDIFQFLVMFGVVGLKTCPVLGVGSLSKGSFVLVCEDVHPRTGSGDKEDFIVVKAVSARPLSVPSTPVGRQSKNPNVALTEQNKQAVRIPSTWSDASDKVNIDLDNLGMKKAPVKQSIPMSQMAKMSASSTPNIGQHSKCWLMFFYRRY
uniref:Uncharacterized protein n=1 Tax=Parascaris equorum TaxID=6256 RepID=A0A914S4Y5_PAREQ